MGVTLGIECSQRQSSVAVRGSDGVVRSAILESASGIDDQLLIQIDSLIRAVGAGPQDLSLVGASLGPGGFTGLRISLATAKMLAKTCRCDLVGVPTAAVAVHTWRAKAQSHADVVVGVALATKRSETWLAIAGGGNVVQQGQVVDEDGLGHHLQASKATILLADDTFPEALRQVAHCAGATVQLLECSSSACLELAEAQWRNGHTVAPEALVPLYPREPEAVRVFQGPKS
ncbi:MAG: tRNA (adenosine(37)-N6)-threonylcarbamoyltransferase complex dimerization subunit type 1 TsaB [Phycisphaerales bacterium]|nr:tRNA (adenosine(37)-N6)-threonylcarbamoyltransferase complex dimerization subunit type 1 TsaB [Phycisphaerales bacterium]